MAFTKLEFTKLWTSATDFPTVETNETQVRADIQLLHDETKDALNNLIDDLEESGASIIAAEVSGRTATTVQGILSEINTDVAANTTARHTHSNKALLDTYTQTEVNIADAVSSKHTHSNKSVLDLISSTVKSQYDRLVAVFTGVTRVVNTLTALDTDIPTAKAVTDAMSSAGNGDMMKSAYATQSDTKVDTALNAEALNGVAANNIATKDDIEDIEAALEDKADLVDGKVPSTQLPELNYIPVPANPTDGYVLTYQASTQSWIPQAIPPVLTEVYSVGTTAPTNTKLLWIDTTAVTGGLKYYDSTALEWKHVPVAFTQGATD